MQDNGRPHVAQNILDYLNQKLGTKSNIGCMELPQNRVKRHINAPRRNSSRFYP